MITSRTRRLKSCNTPKITQYPFGNPVEGSPDTTGQKGTGTVSGGPDRFRKAMELREN